MSDSELRRIVTSLPIGIALAGGTLWGAGYMLTALPFLFVAVAVDLWAWRRWA